MWQAEVDTVWLACHSFRPNSFNHGEILLVYSSYAAGLQIFDDFNVFWNPGRKNYKQKVLRGHKKTVSKHFIEPPLN